MNGSQYETSLSAFRLGLGVAERGFRYSDIVPDVAQLDRRALVLRIDRGPAIELQAARRRAVAQEHERDRSILRRVARANADDARIAARDDLGPALEVGRIRQQYA